MTYTTASGMRSRMKSVKSMEKAATSIELPLGGAMLRKRWTIAREASLSWPCLVTTDNTAISEPVVPWTIAWTRAGCAEVDWVSRVW